MEKIDILENLIFGLNYRNFRCTRIHFWTETRNISLENDHPGRGKEDGKGLEIVQTVQ